MNGEGAHRVFFYTNKIYNEGFLITSFGFSSMVLYMNFIFWIAYEFSWITNELFYLNRKQAFFRVKEKSGVHGATLLYQVV